MRIVLLLIASLIASALLTSPSKAASPNGACTALLNAYETESKQASLSWAEGFADNSAPRATLRNLEVNNHLMAKQIDLTLLIQHKCQIPPDPVSTNDYPTDALGCHLAMMKAPGSDARLPACNMENWKRGVH
jgi:hypothetical protein